MSDNNKLASQDHWSKRWASQKPNIEFDPEKPFFSEIHALFKRTLPSKRDLKILEVGCYPGTYLWYFDKYFDYKVAGIEYVEECVQSCKDIMGDYNIDADVVHADLFQHELKDDERADIVTSFGFIEHFVEVSPVIDKHLDLLKSGGHLALVIPNHAGLNGKILKAVDRDKYDLHNHMSYEDMKQAVLDTGRAEIIEGGYYGHLGFWNTALYAEAKKKGNIFYFLVRAPLYILEAIGQHLIPNGKFFAPNSALVARKID